MKEQTKVIIVIPAFNVAHVLAKTVSGLPTKSYDEIIVVDDGSTDGTAEVGKKLGLTVVGHPRNSGYGRAQKTGYKEALKRGAGAVVLVHGDNQYDPSLVPLFAGKIIEEGYDLVTGTRMVLGDALAQGMPFWKFFPNRFLTGLENFIFGTQLTDYHNGFRAYSSRFLKQAPLELLSDRFDFDTDIIIQCSLRKYRMAEIPHPTRYTQENSQMSFLKGIVCGVSILRTIAFYCLHKAGIYQQRVFSL